MEHEIRTAAKTVHTVVVLFLTFVYIHGDNADVMGLNVKVKVQNKFELRAELEAVYRGPNDEDQIRYDMSYVTSLGALTCDVDSFVFDADGVDAVLRWHELDVVDVSRQVTNLASLRFAAG
jgi:hypothetical protein